jgi:predicted methyltransferase
MEKKYFVLSFCLFLAILIVLVCFLPRIVDSFSYLTTRFFGTSKLIIKERDRIYHPDTVISLLKVKSGDVIADIEPGPGYWTFRFAKATGPKGYVYAVEAYPEWNWNWLKLFEKQVADKRTNPYNNVRFIRSPVDSIGLPPQSVDLAFLCQTGLFLSRPEDLRSDNPKIESMRRKYVKPHGPLLKSIYDALKPGGRAVAIDMF